VQRYEKEVKSEKQKVKSYLSLQLFVSLQRQTDKDKNKGE